MKTPTDIEIEVLREAKAFYGRHWRAEIHEAWLNGNYKGFPRDWVLLRSTAGFVIKSETRGDQQ